MKTKGLLLALLGIMWLSLPAAAFELTDSITGWLDPVITMEKDDSGVTVNYVFPGAYLHEDDLYPDSFILGIPGFGSNMTPGEAAWPIRWDTFEIPYGCEATVRMLSIQTSEFQMKLAPARQDRINSSNEVYSLDNVLSISDYSGWLPQSSVEQGTVKIYRDRNILYVGVYPISYNVSAGIVRAAERLSYHVMFSPGLMTQSRSDNTNSRHSVDEDYMDTVFTSIILRDNNIEDEIVEIGDNEVYIQADNFFQKKWTTGDSYLILSRNLYSSAVNRFAEWKRTMGFNVEVEMSDSWTPQAIKSTVQAKYDSDSKLMYLLLFGDEIDLPGEEHYIFENMPFYTDYFYTCMDGPDDDMPDLYSGRISVTSLQEANTVVDKIINYEKLETSGKDKAVLCALFDDRCLDGYEDNRFTLTCEDIATGLEALGKSVNRVYLYDKHNPIVNATPTHWEKGNYGFGKPIPDYLDPSVFNWNGNKEDIKSAINSGVGYVLHRDHGQIQKWSDPEFLVDDVKTLDNGHNTPIVFSINCLTGMYQYIPPIPNMSYMEYDKPPLIFGHSTCLSEAFLRLKDGGAVAVVAASHVSYNDNNDAFTMELFQLIWPESQFRTAFRGYVPNKIPSVTTPIRKLGELLHASKLRLSQTFADIGSTQHNNQIYHLFGDPSMEIREALPKSYHVSVRMESQNSSNVIIDIPLPYKLVRVPEYTVGKVAWCHGGTYLFSKRELEGSKFYVIGADIAPTPLPEFSYAMQLSEPMRIDNVYTNGGLLTITYTNPEKRRDAVLTVRRVSDGMTQSIDCGAQGNQVSINLGSQCAGVYAVELWSENNIMDTRKIILQ